MSVDEAAVVSVVVPTRDSERVVEACLRSIRAQTYEHVEVIVVDNASSDRTAERAEPLADLVIDSGPERSAQRNAGAAAARGAFLLFVDSDMELTPGVVAECVAVAQRTGCPAVVVPETSRGVGFWARCKALERSFYVGVEWMEAARFFAADAFRAVGGYDEANTGTEDYDLPQRIAHRHGPGAIGRVVGSIAHDEGRLRLVSTCRKKYYYAQDLDRYRAKPENQGSFRRQASPLARYALFLGQPGRLMRHPVVGAGMLLMKTCEFAAGAAGYAAAAWAARRSRSAAG